MLSAEQSDSQSREINVVDESQAERRFVPMQEAEKRCEITIVTKTKSWQSKRKASKTSASISTQKKSRKFSWTPELDKAILEYTKEFQTKCEFSGVDFEAELQSLYTEVRQFMAIDNSKDFGPELVSLPGAEVKYMDTAEYNVFKKRMDEEKARVRREYERIRERMKSLRQDYRAPVNKGTQSGSSKPVQDNFDLQTEIWEGSPPTTSLPFGIDGDTIGEETDTQDPKAHNKGTSL